MTMSNKELRLIPPFRVYFVRHAMSANNASLLDDVRSGETAAVGRQADPVITEKGQRQAAVAGEYFQQLNASAAEADWKKVDTLHCSLMRRALHTVKGMNFGEDVKIVGWGDLHEEGGLFHGSREASVESALQNMEHGLSKEEITNLVPVSNVEELSVFGEKGGWWRGGRESAEEVEARAASLYEKIWKLAETKPSRAHIFITHGMVQDRLKRRLLSVNRTNSATDPVFYPTSNCGIDVFDFKIHPQTGEKHLATVQLNNDEYIPRELRNGHTCGGFKI